MFTLGNHAIDEIIVATAQDFNDELLYTVDQLSTASVEISAESTDITDKKGNVVRTLYTSKTGTFNSTNAFLHPAIMNAASGSEIEVASSDKKIVMPKIEIVAAGSKINVADAQNIHVIGIYNNGANSAALELDTTASFVDGVGKYAVADDELEVPAKADDAPVSYLVKYDREVESGIKMSNTAKTFPKTVRLTLQASYVDPCSDTLKPCYIYFPSFMADPSQTISFDRENVEIDFNGTLQIDYCGCEQLLYAIYYPDEDLVQTGIC